MAYTYKYSNHTKADSDQEWVTDVTNIAKNQLQWNGSSLTPKVDNLVVNKAPAKGIQVDTTNPTFGWMDLLGYVQIDEAAASNRPAFVPYINGIKQYQFVPGDRIYINFHIPHDYVPGTDIFIHAHWSTITGTAGSVTWEFESIYAKGHQQQHFTDVKVLTTTQNFEESHKHMISEIQYSDVGGTSNRLNTSDLEVDGVIILRCTLLSKTLDANPFLHYVDIHYQSTGIGTKNKAPNFYG